MRKIPTVIVTATIVLITVRISLAALSMRVETPTPQALYGTWTVVEATSSPSENGVTNITAPSYIGLKISMSPEQLSWVTHNPPAYTSNACMNPVFSDGGNGVFRIKCKAGKWGPAPGATLWYVNAHQLKMVWYNLITLKLEKTE